MATHRLGDPSEPARPHLAKARDISPALGTRSPPSSFQDWHDQLFASLALRQAEALLGWNTVPASPKDSVAD